MSASPDGASALPIAQPKPRLRYVIERGLFGYIVRTELDWFPAKDWDEAIQIRDREQKQFEEECAAIEAEHEARKEPK